MSRFHPLLRFIFVAVSFYLLWFFGYEQHLAPDGRLDEILTHNITTASATVLRLVGFDAQVTSAHLNTILISGKPAVSVGPYCDGMVLYALFSGFVLAFPGSSLHKTWFIPLGCALIYGINILRIAALSINHSYFHKTVDFNHHYTFTFIVYGCIFLLWIWWATRLADSPARVSYLSS